MIEMAGIIFDITFVLVGYMLYGFSQTKKRTEKYLEEKRIENEALKR